VASNQTAQRVVHSFLAGESDYSGAMRSYRGEKIYTYDVCLAYRDTDGTVCVTPCMARRYSMTSDRHQRAVRAILPGDTPMRGIGGDDYGTLDDNDCEWFSSGSYFLNNYRHKSA